MQLNQHCIDQISMRASTQRIILDVRCFIVRCCEQLELEMTKRLPVLALPDKSTETKIDRQQLQLLASVYSRVIHLFCIYFAVIIISVILCWFRRRVPILL